MLNAGRHIELFKNIGIILNTDLSHLGLGEGEKNIFTVRSLFNTFSPRTVFYLTRFPHFLDMLVFSAPMTTTKLFLFPIPCYSSTSHYKT